VSAFAVLKQNVLSV